MTRRRTISWVALFAVAAAGIAGWLELRRRGDPPSRTYATDGTLLRDVSRPRQPPNLVLLVIDTLRADALDPGPSSSRPTSMPFLAEKARQGVLFRQASSAAPWTMPAVGSLLTGLLPSRHGGLDYRRGPSLPAAATTFAELLGNGYGYDTAAFVDTPWVGGVSAFGQGFARYEGAFRLASAPAMLESWAAQRDPRRPFFLYLHSNDAHDPYGEANHGWPYAGAPDPALDPADVDEPWEMTRAFLLDRALRLDLMRRQGDSFVAAVTRYMATGHASDPRPELVDELRRAYYDGARWVDEGITRLVRFLEERGALENTLVVVTSDHGEAFGEHGSLGHSRVLFDELLRIPLVAWGPAPFRGGAVVDESVGLVDVMPTFLDLAGLEPLDGVDGRSFLRVVSGDEPGRPVFAEEIRCYETSGIVGDVFLGSVRTNQWKYVLEYHLLSERLQERCYDLLLDPGERQDLLDGVNAPPSFDPAFCRAIERVRDAMWKTIDANRAAPTGAAGPVGREGPVRPQPCASR